MRHFDVQMIGGLTLHQGKIAEMRTGEGKTLVATLSAYLNALSGDAVHVITVNDYLARRDAQWMAPLYQALGMSVGVIQSYQGADSPNSFYLAASDEGSSRRVLGSSPMPLILPMAPIMNSVLIIYETTWPCAWMINHSADSGLRLLMR